MNDQWCVVDGRCLLFSLSLETYTLDATLRAAHELSDVAFSQVSAPVDGMLKVKIEATKDDASATEIARRFSALLIDYSLRERIRAETRLVRDLIVAQAFAEADLLTSTATDADYNDDPAGITASR